VYRLIPGESVVKIVCRDRSDQMRTPWARNCATALFSAPSRAAPAGNSSDMRSIPTGNTLWQRYARTFLAGFHTNAHTLQHRGEMLAGGVRFRCRLCGVTARKGPTRTGGQQYSCRSREAICRLRVAPRGDTSAEARRVTGANSGGDTVDVLWCGQAQPPPTMYISWQGRYTDNLHVVTSSAQLIFVSRSMEVQGV